MEARRKPEHMSGVEIVSRRQRNVKHFRLDEHTCQAIVYPEAVHQRAADGTFREIDNTLELHQKTNGRKVYRNRCNDFYVEMAESVSGDNLVTIKRGNHEFAWQFEGPCTERSANISSGRQMRHAHLKRFADYKGLNKNRSLEKSALEEMLDQLENEEERRTNMDAAKSQARYDEVLPGISVQYSLFGEKLKEDIIVANADALKYAVLRLPAEYEYHVDENAEVHILDQEKDEVFRMTRPVVYDSAGHQTIAQPVLERREAYVRLSYKMDPVFLQEAVYPITIDPVFKSEKDKSVISDTYIWKDKPNTNYGDVYLMRCGHGRGGESLSLIKLNRLVEQTASDTIISAKLRLSPEEYGSATEYFGCYPIKGHWEQNTATWNSMAPDTTNMISDEVLSYIDSSNSLFNYFNITNVYRSWYEADNDGKAKNYGVAIRYPKGVNTSDQYVEWTATSGVTERCPHFIINYVSHAGRAPWWQYEGMSAGRTGSAYVDLYNGNVVYERADVVASGSRMPFAVSHVYNSCLSATNEVGCGMGWRTTLHQSVHKETIGSADYYVWTDGNATEHYFKISGSQPYADGEGMSLKLKVANDTITITDKSDQVMYFPKATNATKKWLTKVVDACGNEMTLSYCPDAPYKIHIVKDGAARETTFVYDDDTNLLTSITTPGYPSVQYVYNGNDTLGEVNYQLSETLVQNSSKFTYANNMLVSAENADGIGIQITYEEARTYAAEAIDNYAAQVCRATSLEQVTSATSLEQNTPALVGTKKTFEYLNLTTKVTAVSEKKQGVAEDGTPQYVDTSKTITYQFNDAGNLVSAYDELGYAQFQAFSSTVPNQQTAASKLQRAVMNHLKNIDFTSDWAGSSETVVADSEQRCLGMPSCKMPCESGNISFNEQQVTLQGGKSYTFSAYVRSEAECQAYLEMKGGTLECKSRTQAKSTMNSSRGSHLEGWERLVATMDVPVGETVEVTVRMVNEAGVAWYALPQLEEGHIPNRVNLLINGNFERTTEVGAQVFAENWTPAEGISDLSENGVVDIGVDEFPYAWSRKAMQIHSYCDTIRNCHRQLLSVTGKSGDVYVVGGWVNAKSVANGSTHFKPALIVRFMKTDGTWGDWMYQEYGAEHVGWKFGAWAVAAPHDYKQMEFGVQYARNSGVCRFTNVFVHREQFGDSFAYDDNNNLLSTTNLAEMKSDMKYDSFNNLTSYTQPGAEEGVKYTLTYGSTDAEKKQHLVYSVQSPMGLRQEYEYEYANENEDEQTDNKRNGNCTVSRVIDTENHVYIQSEVAYNENKSYVVEETDARGNKILKDINGSNGQVNAITDPVGNVVRYEYDVFNRVVAVYAGGQPAEAETPETESTEQNAHEANPANETQPVDTAIQYRNAYTYVNDRIATVSHNTTTNECDVTYNFTYDALGRKTAVMIGDQLLSSNEYTDDRRGLLHRVVYGNSETKNGLQTHVVEYGYDDFDRIQSIKYCSEDTPRYEYEYGANGQCSYMRDNHLQRTQHIEYDLSERPNQYTLRNTGTGELLYRTTLDYDKMNRLESLSEQIEDESHQTTYAYDNDNRPTALQFDGEADSVTYTYDSLGRIATRTTKCGAKTIVAKYEYVEGASVDGREGTPTTTLISAIRYHDGDANDPFLTYEYAYDKRGNITQEICNGVATNYTYDSIGQLIRVNDPHENVTWVYTYDYGGNILSKDRYAYTTDMVGTAVETIPYTYGNNDWKDQLTEYNGKKICYDAIGNPVCECECEGACNCESCTWANGKRKYTWMDGRKLKSIEMAATVEECLNATDGVDAEKDIRLSITIDADMMLSAHVYSQGVEVTDTVNPAQFVWTKIVDGAEVEWLSGEKIVAMPGDAEEVRCTVMREGEFCEWSIDSEWNLIHTCERSDDHDVYWVENGELRTSLDATENPYVLEDGELKVAKLPVTLTASAVFYAGVQTKKLEFEYDSNGLRTQKKEILPGNRSITTDYTLNGKQITHLRRVDVNGNVDTMHFFYDAHGRPAKLLHNGKMYIYMHNLQGDIVGILDSTGVLVVEYKYDAWGKPLDSIGTMVDTLGKRNPFRYRGYVYDEETGLYYLQSRYYCSEIHRFINSDSVMGIQGKLTSHNMFAYCCNVPVMLADKNGRNASMVTRIISTVKKLGNAIVSACILNLVDAVTQTKNTRRNGKLISCSIKNATITVKDAESHNDAVENTVKWTKRLLGGAVGYSVALPSLKGITGIITAWAAEDSVDVISDMFVDSHAIIPGEYLSIQATYQYTHKDYFIDCSNDFIIYELRIYGSGYIEAWEFRCGCGIISAGAEKIGSITFAEMGF